MYRTLCALVCALALVLAACGGDDADTAADDAADANGIADDAVDADGDADVAAAAAVEITAVDYAFEGVPSDAEVGTELTLTNTSDVELHEIVLVRLPDGEDRPLPELLELPEEELFGLLGPNLVGVNLAPPSSDGFVAEGDLILSEPGRYALLCFIPTGVDPDEYIAAAEDPDREGPPQVEGAGPPHIVHGMFAEVTVGE